MSPSALERHDLEQDVDELRNSIESLESSRSRLRDVLPEEGKKQSGSIWSDLAEIVNDFFHVAGEALGDEDDEEEEDDSSVGSKVKKVVTTDWSKALSEAFGRLRDRVGGDDDAPPPVAELGGVLGELDSEIARLNADLQQKLDRIAELDRAIDDPDPVQPHHRDVRDEDTTTVISFDDDVDVVPIPLDILPDVDPTPVVIDDDEEDDVIPTPVPDDGDTTVVDVIPVVVPDDDEEEDDTDDDEDVEPEVDPDVITPVDVVDDTPAFETNKEEEIGELDGAIYDVNEILAAGRTVSDLRKYDVPAGVVRDAGVAASAMLDGGYTLAELNEAGCTAADLHGLASAADLRAAGYIAADLHGSFSISECVDAFSPVELRDAGFSVSDFHGLLPASDLSDAFTVAELHTVYSIAELKAAGFDAGDLNAAGIPWSELAAAGFTLSELQGAGASEATLREIFPDSFDSDEEDDDSQ